jgi:hypothetical protein
MITNFEEITAELTAVEIELLDVVKEHLMLHGATQPTKTYEIIHVVNDYCNKFNIPYQLHDPRLRKMISALRINSVLPILATSKGYFVSYNKQLIENHVNSMCQRANSIASAATGLQAFL